MSVRSARASSAGRTPAQASIEAVEALAEHAKASDALLVELVQAVTSRRQVRAGDFWDGANPRLVQLTLQLTEEQVAHLEDVTGRAITTRTAMPR